MRQQESSADELSRDMATVLSSSQSLKPWAAHCVPGNDYHSNNASSNLHLRVARLKLLKSTMEDVRVLHYASVRRSCPRANAADEKESYVRAADNSKAASIGLASQCLQNVCEAMPQGQQVRGIPHTYALECCVGII